MFFTARWFQFYRLWSWMKLLDFQALNCVLKYMLVRFFLFHYYCSVKNRTLRAIVLLFVSNFFQFFYLFLSLCIDLWRVQSLLFFLNVFQYQYYHRYFFWMFSNITVKNKRYYILKTQNIIIFWIYWGLPYGTCKTIHHHHYTQNC